MITNNDYLFLDDVRNPKDVYEYTNNFLYVEQAFIIVRNYNEFVNYITTNGIPYFVSFDHDLGEDQYAPHEVQKEYASWEEWMNRQEFTEKTGYDCAKFLVEYCKNNNIEVPYFYCHSMNPVGKKRIDDLLKKESTGVRAVKQINLSIKEFKNQIAGFDESLISDTYHTFKELYEFRKIYNAALFNEWAKDFSVHPDTNEVIHKYDVHKSIRHNDGELCFEGGWFIVSAQLPTGQISNHYPISDWDYFQIPEFEKCKHVFDGHTSEDVIKRLSELILNK